MPVNSVNNNYTSGVSAYDYQKTQTKAVEEKAAEETKTTTEQAKEDTFVKSTQYKPDMDKVTAMKADLQNNISAFRMMVQGLFQKQGGVAQTAGNPMQALLEIDKATQEAAQAAIAEDGEWGVEQTAQRILDFAMALTGGDPSKAEAMRGAVEQGFAAAEKIWGGKLPDISYQTRERVMQGFDDWVNGTTALEETAEA